MPFRSELRPPVTSGDLGGGPSLALGQPREPCDSCAFLGRDMLEPVSAIEPIISCIPTWSPSSALRDLSSFEVHVLAARSIPRGLHPVARMKRR